MSNLTSAEWAAWAQAGGGILQAVAATVAILAAFRIANNQYLRERQARVEQQAEAEQREMLRAKEAHTGVVRSAMLFCDCLCAFLDQTRAATVLGVVQRGEALIAEIVKWPQQIPFDGLPPEGALILLRMRIAATGALSIATRSNQGMPVDQKWLAELTGEALSLRKNFRELYADVLAGWDDVGRSSEGASEAAVIPRSAQ